MFQWVSRVKYPDQKAVGEQGRMSCCEWSVRRWHQQIYQFLFGFSALFRLYTSSQAGTSNKSIKREQQVRSTCGLVRHVTVALGTERPMHSRLCPQAFFVHKCVSGHFPISSYECSPFIFALSLSCSSGIQPQSQRLLRVMYSYRRSGRAQPFSHYHSLLS